MDWKSKRWQWALGVLALVVFIGAVFIVPALLVHEPKLAEPEEAKALADYRGNILQMFTGLAVLGAGIFTWWRIQIAQQQVRISEEGQITERYSRAIDQLGEQDQAGRSRLDIRIGGIYALERVARDAQARQPEGTKEPARDHATVVEVLSSFVVTHIGEGRPAETGDESEQEQGGPTRAEPWRPPPDVGAALKVLGRQSQRAHLERLDATGAYLTRAELGRANLGGANLRGAHLEGANLAEAYLGAADLGGAHLEGAHLEGADLAGADLAGADLTFARLAGAYLMHADLTGADLTLADLTGAMHDDSTRWPEGFTPPG